jgi:hypothetical protein
MLAGGKAKGGAGTSEAKSLLEIEFTPNYSVGQFSEVNLYWFSSPSAESSEVILTDPNGVVVFTSDKTGGNSEVFISDVIGTYTATITATSIPGGDAKTKEELLYVQEGKIPSVSTWSEADSTLEDNLIFNPNTGLDVDTKFWWGLSSYSGPMSFLIEVSDPDGEIIHSVSGDAVEERGSYIHTTDIVGEYTITATATNILGTTTDTETILCESWSAVQDGASVSSGMAGFAWYPKPDSGKIIAPRMTSKWGWWFELQDCYNPGDRYYPQTPPYVPEGIPTGEPKHPYDVIFKYNTGTATEAKFELIDPDGLVDFEKDNLELSLMYGNSDRELNFWYDANMREYFPTKRGMYTGRLTLKNRSVADPVIVEHGVPCYNDLADKESNPNI